MLIVTEYKNYIEVRNENNKFIAKFRKNDFVNLKATFHPPINLFEIADEKTAVLKCSINNVVFINEMNAKK